MVYLFYVVKNEFNSNESDSNLSVSAIKMAYDFINSSCMKMSLSRQEYIASHVLSLQSEVNSYLYYRNG